MFKYILIQSLLLGFVGMLGCGVRGDPAPYVDANAPKTTAERNPKSESESASGSVMDGNASLTTEKSGMEKPETAPGMSTDHTGESK